MSDPIPPANPSRQPNRSDGGRHLAMQRRFASARTPAEEIEERYAAWAKARRLKRSRGVRHPARLAGRRPRWRAAIELSQRRWVDHSRFWIRDGRPACFTSEPYGLSERDRREIQELAEKYGLVVVIGPPGECLWYPGRTRFIQLWASGAGVTR